jgi:hypothetical protein
MARRRSEFLGLTHIDDDHAVTDRKAPLQFNDLDPSRRIRAGPPE